MLKNTLTVLRGTAAAQAIGFLALPWLTRLYTPESFGLFQLYQSTLAPLLVIAAVRYEVALLQAADGAELASTLQLCLLINTLIALLVLLATSVAWFIPDLLSDTTKQMVWLLPPAILISGCLQTVGYLALRKQAFSPAATAKMAQAGGYVVTGVGIGAAAQVSSGLVVADLIGRLASVFTFCLHKSVFESSLFVRSSATELRRVARKFRDLPLVSAPGQLINAAGGVMTAAFMYGAFDASVSGQYGLVERSMLLPVGMVTVAVSQAFTADLSNSLRSGGTHALALYRGLVRRMFLLALVPTMLMGLFAPLLFAMVFGEQWSQAGRFAQIMSPLLLVTLVSGSVNMAITILGYQKIQLAWETSRLALMSITWLIIFNLELLPQTAVLLHVAASGLVGGSYLWLADHTIRHHASTHWTETTQK